MNRLKEFLKDSNKVVSLMISLAVVFVFVGLGIILIKVMIFMGFWFVIVPISIYITYKYISSKKLF